MFESYAEKYPELAEEFTSAAEGKLPVNLDEILPTFKAGDSMATRKASGMVLAAVMPKLPMIMGGSADLTPSNNTNWPGAKDFQKSQPDGRYIRFGIREHAMGSILNGISVSGMVRAYGGTFFVFSDYMRPAVRVAAISHYPSIFIWTHDSIGVGEDGPTHQPVEHLASLRAIPNLWFSVLPTRMKLSRHGSILLEHKDGPVALLLTRQNLPVLDQEKYGSAKNTGKGAYVLITQKNPDVLIMATGSEVSLALSASEALDKDGIKAQVISMPSWELFEKQPQSYKDSVLPPKVKARIAIEAGIELGWHKYIGDKGIFIGMSSFGASAPAKVCFEKFGITSDAVIKAAKKLNEKNK